MRGVIGSEVLRSVSGLSALAVYLVALLIPVEVLATGREDFVRDLQQHLRRGQGHRPL